MDCRMNRSPKERLKVVGRIGNGGHLKINLWMVHTSFNPDGEVVPRFTLDPKHFLWPMVQWPLLWHPMQVLWPVLQANHVDIFAHFNFLWPFIPPSLKCSLFCTLCLPYHDLIYFKIRLGATPRPYTRGGGSQELVLVMHTIELEQWKIYGVLHHSLSKWKVPMLTSRCLCGSLCCNIYRGKNWVQWEAL